jgi:asparagine synthase (glutamine-hydrolysing)
MCGIAGLLGWRSDDPQAAVESMTAALRHRGPDDHGHWIDAELNVALGHRRLSILDLSAQGHQPMLSRSGRFVMAYNGEIYNFQDLRSDIEAAAGGWSWRGHSDTEVLLAAMETWGVRSAIERTVGMFAIAVWDRQGRELWLARDRIGEKPLYYGRLGEAFAFASEPKAFVAIAPSRLEIDRDAVAEFMQFGYVPAPRTIYRGIGKLNAGCLVRVTAASVAGASERYWSLDTGEHAELTRTLSTADDAAAIGMLDGHLSRAVGQQMVADVPLGAFLSGGIDSSLIVALMQARSARKVRTFTIGFSEAAFDEAPFARGVAQHLGTDHTELYVAPADAAAVIPKLPLIFDEPFADSSQIPTSILAELTRKQVTVSLSGDGGDELFAGYPRYIFAQTLWRRIQSMPGPLRGLVARTLRAVPPRTMDNLLTVAPMLAARGVSGHRLMRLSQLLGARTFGESYVRLVSQWQPEDGLVAGASVRRDVPAWPAGSGSGLQGMRRWDLAQYLADDILVKVDRSAMHASLESRAPLLDHRVVEFAFALPDRMLVRDGEAKWLLKRLLDRYVPRALIDRPKAGFGLPLAEWLRGPLREWAEDLLDEQAIRSEGLLDAGMIGQIWRDHLKRRAERQAHLWNVLMFQAWLRATAASRAVAAVPPRGREALHA